MSIELITRVYAVMLVIKALLFTLMFLRCMYAIWRNHIGMRVRIMIWGMAAMSLFLGADSWVRAYGRIVQCVNGIVPTQSNPLLALVTLVLADIGITIWITTTELTTHLGIIPYTRDKSE